MTSSINSQSSDLHKSSTAGNSIKLSAIHVRERCAFGNDRFYADKTTAPLRAMIMSAHERRSLFFICGAAEAGILRFVQ